MKNSAAVAAKWTEFIAVRAEFPAAHRLRDAFWAGTITRLCDCGCNSFNLKVPDGAGVEALTKPGAAGAIFDMSFRTSDDQKTLDLIIFVDERGHLSGIDIDYCSNAFPVPDQLTLVEPPFHVRLSRSVDA